MKQAEQTQVVPSPIYFPRFFNSARALLNNAVGYGLCRAVR
jgi:hypothetical protein